MQPFSGSQKRQRKAGNVLAFPRVQHCLTCRKPTAVDCGVCAACVRNWRIDQLLAAGKAERDADPEVAAQYAATVEKFRIEASK